MGSNSDVTLETNFKISGLWFTLFQSLTQKPESECSLTSGDISEEGIKGINFTLEPNGDNTLLVWGGGVYI